MNSNPENTFDSREETAMSSFKSLQSKRFVAGIMALMMLVIVLFSVTFIAAEAEHDCCGDDCSICSCIRLCENTLKQIGNGSIGQTVVIIPIFLLCISIPLSVCIFKQETPVSRKIRLNN